MRSPSGVSPNVPPALVKILNVTSSPTAQRSPAASRLASVSLWNRSPRLTSVYWSVPIRRNRLSKPPSRAVYSPLNLRWKVPLPVVYQGGESWHWRLQRSCRPVCLAGRPVSDPVVERVRPGDDRQIEVRGGIRPALVVIGLDVRQLAPLRSRKPRYLPNSSTAAASPVPAADATHLGFRDD